MHAQLRAMKVKDDMQIYMYTMHEHVCIYIHIPPPTTERKSMCIRSNASPAAPRYVGVHVPSGLHYMHTYTHACAFAYDITMHARVLTRARPLCGLHGAASRAGALPGPREQEARVSVCFVGHAVLIHAEAAVSLLQFHQLPGPDDGFLQLSLESACGRGGGCARVHAYRYVYECDSR